MIFKNYQGFKITHQGWKKSFFNETLPFFLHYNCCSATVLINVSHYYLFQ